MVDWPGLFKWSTNYHDGTAPTQFKPLSDEDRHFLEKAMEEAFSHIEDPNKVMLEACNQIKAADRTDASIITSLEVIDRMCDDPDVARNAEKLDGIQPMLDLVGSHRGQIQVRSLEILALLFSNNPVLQEVGMKRGAMGVFLQQIHGSAAGSEARGKSFRALAALIRKNKPLEEKFLKEHNGLDVLLLCIAPVETQQSREKATNFVNSLVDDTELAPHDVERLAAAVAVLIASPGYGSESIQYRESVADCVLQLSKPLVEAAPASVTTAMMEAACKQRSLQCGQAERKEDVEQELAQIKEAYKVLLSKGK